MFDRVWLNANLATMTDDAMGIVADGAVAAQDGRIAWVGPRAALPGPAAETTDCEGAWILPGLIDCHTHLVFAGDRSGEFEQRVAGATYREIAEAGGGILYTTRETRAATEAALLDSAHPRLAALAAEGVTTVEIKSGYGLDIETEVKMLRVARALGAEGGPAVVTTLLAAHALPPEWSGRRAAFARFCAAEIMPAAIAAGVVDAVDCFHDSVGFDDAETRVVLDAARAAGLPVKLHADQHSAFGSAQLAADCAAISADHLECSDAAGLAAMARAGTVAVLLPGATYFLRMDKHPDIAAMRRAGVRIAIASDMNPGSCPARSLLLMLNLACTLFRMTVPEALAGVTRHAAAALGLADRGVLRAGARCDLALYRITRPAELCYWIGGNPCIGSVVAGRVSHGLPAR